mgnify:FL=1
MEPASNHDRGAFEGKVCGDLEWIKAAIKSIQCLCDDRGKRIGECESSILVMQNTVKCAQGHEERIRAAEKGLTQVKTVGGVLGTLGGILASLGIKLWGGH